MYAHIIHRTYLAAHDLYTSGEGVIMNVSREQLDCLREVIEGNVSPQVVNEVSKDAVS